MGRLFVLSDQPDCSGSVYGVFDEEHIQEAKKKLIDSTKYNHDIIVEEIIINEFINADEI